MREILSNPRTQEKITVLESNEEVFRITFELPPRAQIAGTHRHPLQTQTLSVVRGELVCRVGDRTVTIRPGESHDVAPGVLHDQANPGAEPVEVLEEYRPARRMHAFFRVLFALARDGHTTRTGVPYPLVGAALFAEFEDSITAGSWLERAALIALRPFAGLFGRDRLIRAYLERDLSEPARRPGAAPRAPLASAP